MFLRKSSRAEIGLRGTARDNVQKWDCVSAECHPSYTAGDSCGPEAARCHQIKHEYGLTTQPQAVLRFPAGR